MTLETINKHIQDLEDKISHQGEGTQDTYSRITGYMRPVTLGQKQNWNSGKFQEFKERLEYKI